MEWHKKTQRPIFYKRTDIFVIQTRDNKGLFVEDIDVSALWKSCWCGNYGKLRGAAWGENFGCSEFKPRIFIKNSPNAGSSLNSQHMSNTTAFSHSSTTIECSASFCWYLEHGTHTHGIHVFCIFSCIYQEESTKCRWIYQSHGWYGIRNQLAKKRFSRAISSRARTTLQHWKELPFLKPPQNRLFQNNLIWGWVLEFFQPVHSQIWDILTVVTPPFLDVAMSYGRPDGS